jgi:simple sugar transport system permease protein
MPNLKRWAERGSKHEAKHRTKPGEPVTDTNLLLTITIGTFFGMYALAMAVWGGGFLNPQQFLDLFNNNAALIIVSVGLSTVMAAGGIDISVGGIITLVSMSCVVCLDDKGFGVAGVLLLALGTGLAFGLVQGFLIAFLEIQPFIVTLAGLFFAKGMTTIVSAAPRTATNPAFLALKNLRLPIPGLGSYGKSGNFIPASLEPGVVIALLTVAAIFILLRWTKFGRGLYAIGGNQQSALMLGINVKRARFFSYLLCGLLSGIAGFVYLLHTGSGDAANAAGAEMEAIASSIIGGTLLTGGVGNVAGTLFGTLSLKTITSIVVASGLREPYWQKITTGAMLCLFVLLQSVVLARRSKAGLRLPLAERLKGKRKAGDAK